MHRTLAFAPLALALFACGSSSGTPDASTDHDAAPTGDVVSDASADTSEPSDDTPTSDPARDFTLDARGMTASMGKPLSVWVLATDGRQVLAYATLASIDQADVTLRLPSLVPEGDYTAEAWVDGNGNGSYDGPTTDPSWRVSIPGNGSANVVVQGGDATTDIGTPARSGYSDFTMHLAGLSSDEAGKRFELRVIDQGSGATVGGYAQPALPSGATATVSLPGIVQPGSGYDVDFWIDLNGDGVYSGQGIDRTWRVSSTAGDTGATVDWTQDTNYTEIDWR